MEDLIRINEELNRKLDNMTLILDSLPFGIRIVSLDDGKLVYANKASMDIFGCEDFERDVAGRSAFDFMPEIQPNGRKTLDMANEFLQAEKATEDFQCFKLDGEPFTARITNFCANYMGKMSSLAIIEDITEKNQAEDALKRRANFVDAMKEMDTILLSQKGKTFDYIMGESLRPIADAANLDRVDIYRLLDFDGERRFGQVYRWSKAEGGLVSIDENLRSLPDFPAVEKWGAALSKGQVVNIHAGVMSGEETAFLEPLNIKSLLLTPVLIDEALWGVVAFQDLARERLHDDDAIGFLCSAARLCANAIIKNELAETEQHMRLMLDATPLCCQLWNSDFKKIDCNKEAIRLFGFKDKQEFMERYHELYPEYQLDGQRSEEKVAMQLKKTADEGWCSFDWTYKMLDGTLMPTEAILVRVNHGEDHVLAGYTRDLREHDKMMKDIYERELELIHVQALNELQLAKLALVVQATKIGLWEMEVVNNDPVNPANTFTWSDEFRNLLGFSDETDFPNVLGSWINQLHPEDKDESLDHLEKHLLDTTGSTPYDKEYRLLKKNGECAYFRAYGGTFRDEKGNAILISGALMDITETKNTLINNELQLTKLDLMVKAAKIGLWEMEVVKDDPVNPANAFLWSDELRHMLGFSDENDFPNILASWSDRLHPEDKGGTLESFENHLLDMSGNSPYDVEYRLLKKDGEYAYYRACGETIRDEKGNPLRVAGALMNITETKNMLLEIEKQRMDAEAANKAKSDFLSAMSHEIRTPMNAILGITEIQLRNETLEGGVREKFEKIHVAGDLLLGIINDILDLSKIEADKFELMIDVYEIASLINDTAQLNMTHIGSKPIDFVLHIDENTPALLSGDELRVKQILNNLLTNAFKYTEEGKVEFSVSAETGGDDTVILVLRVSDTGLGMTQKQLYMLFDKFTRFTHNVNRSIEGTGLGMSITQNLARLMNGEIFVDSSPGKGSVFTVRLPQARVGSGVLGRELAENLRGIQKSGRTQMKRAQIIREPMPYGSVMIVDDMEMNIYVAEGLLAPYGLKIDSAGSGFEAIERIKEGNFYDIVFMDHMMPKMDGMEATKIMRSMGYHGSIVALTANAVSGQEEIFLSNGFDGFISKPIDVRHLNNILNKMIRDKQTPEVIEAARRQSVGHDEGPFGQESDAFVDPRIIEVFIRDASRSIAALDSINTKDGPLDYEDKRMYETHVHGMKNALANIGKPELSAIAFELEISARDGYIESMTSETSAFIDSLRAIVKDLAAREEAENIEAADENKPFLSEKLLAVKAACDDYDVKTINDAIIQLRKEPWSQPTHNLLAAIARYLLSSDFDEIVDVVDKYFESEQI
ncbi:MAG: PAS domain-containing protein [Deltaproteobacteria bacterium]|nr:PAS domain-containing protein [Deltaproteobacteria bacterium]